MPDFELMQRSGAAPPVAARGGDDAAVILYTSGTTADPKGVVLTHANLEAERQAAFSVVDVSERDAILGVLPLFHSLAQMANLLLPLAVGARVVFLETVSSTSLLQALQTRHHHSRVRPAVLLSHPSTRDDGRQGQSRAPRAVSSVESHQRLAARPRRHEPRAAMVREDSQRPGPSDAGSRHGRFEVRCERGPRFCTTWGSPCSTAMD